LIHDYIEFPAGIFRPVIYDFQHTLFPIFLSEIESFFEIIFVVVHLQNFFLRFLKNTYYYGVCSNRPRNIPFPHTALFTERSYGTYR